MRILLELVRIILLFGFLGSLFWTLFSLIHEYLEINLANKEWMLFLSIFILFFVLYRNRWQFSGWYNGKGREKLPKKVTNVLVFCACLLLILVPFLNMK
ncbi:Uncharacterised protein [Mycobacteroides abscessus subsp. abscessus]|jgi:hypothetical protein|nr:Uncharacterised protein [Mycobacteroides abscessus subsp. abscessus]